MSGLSADTIHAALWPLDADTLDADTLDAADQWEAGEDPGDPERMGGDEESSAGLRLLSIDAYATRFPEPVWLAEPYIAVGRNLFAAPSSMGKTERIADLVAQVTRDGKRVLYVNTDDDPTLVSRFSGRDYVAENLVFVDTELRGDELAAALVETVGALASEGRKPDLVVIDTLSSAWKVESETSYATMNAAALAFWQIFNRHGVAVLLTHHMVKRTDGSFDEVRSAGVTDHADHVVTYTGDPAKTRRRVRTFKRVAHGRDFWIDFNPETKAFRNVDEHHAEERTPLTSGDLIARAVALVAAKPGVYSESSLRDEMKGAGTDTKRTAIKDAIDRKLLAKDGLKIVLGPVPAHPQDDSSGRVH